MGRIICSTQGKFLIHILGEQHQVEMIIQRSSSKSFREAKAASGGCVCCMVMHGQYGLLHAPFISACDIAWGLNFKQNRMYICKTIFFFLRSFLFSVHVHNVYSNVILVLCRRLIHRGSDEHIISNVVSSRNNQ